MAGEKRNLRSNKETSTNGERARSGSQSSSSNKDKPVPTRTTSSRGKALPPKKGSGNTAAKEGSADKPQTNGAEPVENGVNGTEDVEMGDDGAEQVKVGTTKDGEDEMTVVVPPPKSSKLNGEPGMDAEGDVAMENSEKASDNANAPTIDPRVKAITDIKANYPLLEQAVSQFDARFTLRVLRSMSSVRKHLSPDLLAQVITETYQSTSPVAKALLAGIGRESASFEQAASGSEMDIDRPTKDKSPGPKPSPTSKEVLPETDFYISILVQIYLYDTKAIELGAKFSSNVVDRLRTLNRRTLDALSARVYFYYSLFYEQLAPLPPSPLASVVSIRQKLLAALRTSVLRKDQDTRATVTTLLLRNYLSTSHITQADLLISHSELPPAASNNQIARYLYYLGRIRAIQLSYTEAHEHLIGATRKSPASPSAGGFYQAASKLLVVVELLMGDIPDRAMFRQPNLEHAMKPYLSLVQAVRIGKIDGFLNVVQQHSTLFRRDGTYTLVLRLRQNVIKTGIRMMSLSYARISLRDICLKLDLESEESAEYIVAKAIRDGVIEATLDHENAFMKSKEVGDIYATREPGEAFHERIRACLDLHDESVKAMRFPMNQHRLELKNAQEARERERELAKDIVDGDMDDEDGGDFEGMIDVSTRLRRAIHLNDLTLVKRIIKNNPQSLQNPDFGDNGNTSLHLAAQLGLLEIAVPIPSTTFIPTYPLLLPNPPLKAFRTTTERLRLFQEFLIDAGHEDHGISKNANWATPLHLAAETSDLVASLIATRFPRCISWKNKDGANALMLTARTPHLPSLLPLFLSLLPSPRSSSLSDPSPTAPPHPTAPHPLLSAQDNQGNTALHYASAYGQLKSVRALLAAGAQPGRRNAWSWMPVSYSLTVQAEVYFKGLLGEAGKRREGEGRASVEERREGGRRGGLRMVVGGEGEGRERAGSLE